MTQPLGTIGLGVLVFVLWILPDLLLPGYRDSFLLQNGLTGRVESSIPVEAWTESLGDLIWYHVVTNGCLSVWVVGMGEWGYW